MRIPVSDFQNKFKELYLANTTGIATLPYWKMKALIEDGETYYIPEYDCFYMIRNKHLLVYYSPDKKLHIPVDELNALDCISLPADMYDAVKEKLIGFNASYGWGLRYDFDYIPKATNNEKYVALSFNFDNEVHYTIAAEMFWLIIITEKIFGRPSPSNSSGSSKSDRQIPTYRARRNRDAER